MAWERAKGELRSMMHTFYDTMTGSGEGAFIKFEKIFNSFVEDVEDNDYHE